MASATFVFLEVDVSGFAALMVGVVVLVTSGIEEDVKPKYPETKRKEVIDEYHGTKVPDPYRWLEDDVRTNKDVAAWVEAQNKVTDAYLASIPERAAIRQRITDLWNYEKFSAPFKEGERYFYSRNSGLQNQSVLYVAAAAES